jgi:IPTL-CTERM motif
MHYLGALARLLAVAMLVLAGSAHAQTPLLFGVNPFANNNTAPPGSFGLFTLNYNTGAITGGSVVTVPARTITGLNSITLDPTSGKAYAIAKATAVAGRLLITINPFTGAGVEIGNLGDNFATLSFRGGQLFGVTGDGATIPETMYLINKANATKVIATALGNGADGEVIAFHPPDNSFYHWSGNGAIVFERVLAVPPYTVTNIPITGSASGEVFGAVWDPLRNRFLVHNINSAMDFWTTAGVRSNAQAATAADVRGLLLLAVPPDQLPTLSEWAMIVLAALMALGGIVALRRRA